MATITVATYLAQRLLQLGIEHVFTIPGDYCAPFLDAMDALPGLERVPNINELGCGYAADGYARFRGVGAACVQYGVGNFSLLNCVAGSNTELLPVAIISSSPGASSRLLEVHQNILFHHSTGNLAADRNVFEQVTAASVIITDPITAPGEIDRALTLMITYRRPVYIEVIASVWNESCPAPVGELRAVPPFSSEKYLRQAVDAVRDMIARAERPVFFLGVEIQRFGLQSLVQRLVEATGIPFTTTSLGKTVLDEAQPFFAGTYAGPASTPETNRLVLESDCLIALGTIVTDDYLQIMSTSFTKMVRVSQGETRVGLTYFPDVALSDFVPALISAFEDQPLEKEYAIAAKPAAFSIQGVEPGAELTYELFYETLCAFLLDSRLLEKSVLVLGESTSLYVFGNVFGLPQNSFVSQAVWGSLGHETGCALGVALGSGKRPLVIAGDGGFMMVCQELSSLVRAKSDAVIFVMSNHGYAIEQAFVNLAAFEPGGQFALYDELPAWDYGALAKAFGARGVRLTTQAELLAFLDELSLPTDVPTLVEVVVPAHDLPPQLKRLAEPPPSLRRYRRAGSSVNAF
jgi:indolepyruvate decarboxylase